MYPMTNQHDAEQTQSSLCTNKRLVFRRPAPMWVGINVGQRTGVCNYQDMLSIRRLPCIQHSGWCQSDRRL